MRKYLHIIYRDGLHIIHREIVYMSYIERGFTGHTSREGYRSFIETVYRSY